MSCNHRHHTLLLQRQIGNATEAGQALLERWREAGVSRENLYWRSLAQNQQAAEKEVAALYQERNTLENIDPVALQDRLKKLAVIYDRAHAFMDELAAGTGGPPSSYLVGGAMLINSLGNSLLQNKPATLLDKPVNKVAAAVLQAQLGRYAQNIQLEMRGGKPLGRGASARIDRAAQRSFDDALRGGRHGPMVEMRLGGVLAVLDVWNLLNKLAVEDKGSRQYAELVAAILAVTAAGVEIGAAAVALGSRSGSAAVQQGAKVFGGGLRLGAGVLAGTAGLVGAWYDVEDFRENWNAGKYSIGGVYFLRATTQLGGAALSVTVGLAYAKPYLEYLLKKYRARPILGAAVRSGLHASTALALRMTPMLRIFFGLNISIMALLLVELFLFPNQLQRYLDTCTFRKDRTNDAIESEESELNTMQNALRGTL